jgi:hypothetical protein
MLKEEDVKSLENRINILKKDYDLFLAGILKLEPVKGREELGKLIHSHTASEIVNSSLRFKYNSLIQKFNSFNNYWDRMVRLREEARVKIWEKNAAAHASQTATSAAAATAAAAPPKPAPKQNGSVFRSLEDTDLEAKAKKVFDDFTAARAKTGEGAGPDFSRFKSTIEKQLQGLFDRAPGSEVEFKVAVENGKAKLKAVARTKS